MATRAATCTSRSKVPRRSSLRGHTSINGSLTFGAELVLDCELKGTITSTGRLTVDRNAQIRGEIRRFCDCARHRRRQRHGRGTLRVAHRLHIAWRYRSAAPRG
ncbi:MAG: polymer-forming cytoskeletal protein [Chthoniobacterales bacterium]|nr:polymer-forming cytoskeletal protein [Chthoniobacterales bacterium]